MEKKTIIISLLLMPITGLADITVFSAHSTTFPGSGKAGLGESPVNIYWIENINSTKQFNEAVSKVDIEKCNVVLINAGYTYHTVPTDINSWFIDSEYTLGSKDEPLVLNGNGYSEYSPPYNGFYNPSTSGELYDITKHVFYKLGVGNYKNLILNKAAASTGNFYFSSNVNTTMPESISGVTLNDSFFYVNQLGDYNTFTANGHSIVAVVGTYLSHFYTSIPSYHFIQYSGTEYTISQCNNAYIFPGIGLGVLISGATRVTRNMFLASARALASFECKAQGLLPDIRHIHDIPRSIAFSVALAAMMDNVAPSQTLSALTEKMENTFWSPEYTDYHRISL